MNCGVSILNSTVLIQLLTICVTHTLESVFIYLFVCFIVGLVRRLIKATQY